MKRRVMPTLEKNAEIDFFGFVLELEAEDSPVVRRSMQISINNEATVIEETESCLTQTYVEKREYKSNLQQCRP